MALDDRTNVGSLEWFELTSHPRGQPMVPIDFDTIAASACSDTGAGLSVVDIAFAQAHPHLFEAVRAARGVDSLGVDIPSQLCCMAGFNVAGIAVEPSACALVDLGPLNAALEQPISLVMGMPAILQADWSFDFPEHRWSVRRP